METIGMAHPILPPVHPGKILRQEYLEPLSMSAGELAKALRVPRTRIERLIGEKTALTPDTALRLAIYFKTTPEFWMNLQTGYALKLEGAAKKAELSRLTSITAISAAA
jgi:antitoxin HigA-1